MKNIFRLSKADGKEILAFTRVLFIASIFAVIIITLFSSCEKEDNVMFNTHSSTRADVKITSVEVNSYSSIESNITVSYQLENLSYWTIDYYEVMLCIQYIDTTGYTHTVHDVSNGCDLVGHATSYNSQFFSLNGIFLEAYIEDYNIYN